MFQFPVEESVYLFESPLLPEGTPLKVLLIQCVFPQQLLLDTGYPLKLSLLKREGFFAKIFNASIRLPFSFTKERKPFR